MLDLLGFQLKFLVAVGRGFRLLFAASGVPVPELRRDKRCIREDLETSGYSPGKSQSRYLETEPDLLHEIIMKVSEF